MRLFNGNKLYKVYSNMRIIILALVLHFALALHSHHAFARLHTPSRHLASDADKLYFEDEFTNLSGMVDYVKRALSSNNS
jgi:hypothetical protein